MMDRTERELVEMMEYAKRDEIFAEHAAFLERAYRIERQRTKRLRAELEAARDKACEMRDKAHRHDAEMAAEIDPCEWEEGERVAIKAGTLAGATGTVRMVFGASVGVELDANAGRVLCYARDEIEAEPSDTPKGGA